MATIVAVETDAAPKADFPSLPERAAKLLQLTGGILGVGVMLIVAGALEPARRT